MISLPCIVCEIWSGQENHGQARCVKVKGQRCQITLGYTTTHTGDDVHQI